VSESSAGARLAIAGMGTRSLHGDDDADARRTGAGVPPFSRREKLQMPLPRDRRSSWRLSLRHCHGTSSGCLLYAKWVPEVGAPGRSSDCRAHAWMLAVRQVARPGWSLCSRPYLLGCDAACRHVSCPVVGAGRRIPARSGSFVGGPDACCAIW
jgi:hypothetical protein